jgi:hypothetical protein
MVTAMRLHRCLLIACVTLCQACDSKQTLSECPIEGKAE